MYESPLTGELRKIRKSILASDDPQVQTAVAMTLVESPRIELTIVAEFNVRIPTPGPTSVAFWERPGAEKTAIASCPEGTRFSEIVIPSPTPVHSTPVPHEGNYTEFLWAIDERKREYGIR